MRMPTLEEFLIGMGILVFVNSCSSYYQSTELPDPPAYEWEAETSGKDDYEEPCKCSCSKKITTPTIIPASM